MPTLVTVALAGDLDSPPPGILDWSVDAGLTWTDRQRVELQVEDEDTLASILNRAAEEMGAKPFEPFQPLAAAIHWVAFGDDSGTPLLSRRQSELTLVDEHGHAVWRVHDWDLIPFRQLRLAAEAGVLNGDPSRIYLIRQIPQGDLGVVIENWRIFIELLELTRDHFDQIKNVAETVTIFAGVAELIRRGVGVIKRRYSKWAQRGATPASLPFAFSDTSEMLEIARRLDVREDEASATFVLFEAMQSDEPAMKELVRAIARTESVTRYGSTDYRAFFKAQLEAISRGESIEGISSEDFQIDPTEWSAETFPMIREGMQRMEDESDDVAIEGGYEDEYENLPMDEAMSIEWTGYRHTVRFVLAGFIVLITLIVGLGIDARWWIALIASLGIAAALVLIGRSRHAQAGLAWAIGHVFNLNKHKVLAENEFPPD